MHRRASFCAVFRYARQTFAAWPGDWFTLLARSPPSLCFSPGSAPGFFCAPRRFAPADGCRAISGVPGPRVVSLAARPTRFIFVGLTDRASYRRGRPGTLLVRGVRLLGFAPICDPYPAAHLNQLGHGIDPASGFASCRVLGACLRIRSGSTPIESSASGISWDRLSWRTRASLSAHGFSTLAPIVNRRKSRPFSVLMGLMPCRPERLRGPPRACSLSEVLHRP